MPHDFKVGDHVTWNSEAGHVSGHVVRIHTSKVNWKGYTHHASPDEPQYEIKSDKTDHVALHKGSALRHVQNRHSFRSPPGRRLAVMAQAAGW